MTRRREAPCPYAVAQTEFPFSATLRYAFISKCRSMVRFTAALFVRASLHGRSLSKVLNMTPTPERLPTEESRFLIAWIVFGSLVAGVLSAGALIRVLFP